MPDDNPVNLNALDRRLLLSDVEAGFLLGVTPGTIRDLHRVKVLPGVMCGRHLRWKRTDIEHYVEELGGDGSR